MVFSSLFFLCIFLPLNLAAYYIPTKNSTRNVIMLIFSLIFYAWGEPKYIVLLLFMTLACWFFALAIEKSKANENRKNAKLYLTAACVVALGLIAVFKYFAFFTNTVLAVFGSDKVVSPLALPIGISFYTFQLLTYVIDVYRGDAQAQKKYSNLLLYAGLFHQCIAGPIVRYQDIADEITNRKPEIRDFNKGVMRFASGLAKKVLLANTCGSLADTMLLSDDAIADAAVLTENLQKLTESSALTLWFGVLFFMLQIYLDFSAYSDMAIGMGLMTGFHYKENFDYPYISRSVSEFWRRWHISLGTFFKDYVYIPLGGNRKGTIRTVFNLFVVWALTGLWHGASWNFVLWGLYFFAFISLEKLFLSDFFKKLPVAVSHIYLLIVVYFGWILFKFSDMTMLSAVLKGMFCLNGNPFATHEAAVYIADNWFFIVVAIFACTPVVKEMKNIINHFSRRNSAVNAVYSVFRALIPTVLLLASAVCLVGDSYNPFLYFRF